MTDRAHTSSKNCTQEWFLQDGVLQAALRLLTDAEDRCRLKGLLLISCMVRGCAEALIQFCGELQGLPPAVDLVRLSQQSQRNHRVGASFSGRL